MVIALIGYSRFGTVYSGDGRTMIGSKSRNDQFNRYYKSLRQKPAVVFETLSNLRYRRRIVIGHKAYNPSLQGQPEYIPYYQYIYPGTHPVETFTDIYAYGIILKGNRERIFIPMLPIKLLDENEAIAIEHLATLKTITIENMIGFAVEIGIEITDRHNFVNSTGLEITDPTLYRWSRPYHVILNADGKVIDTNVCITTPERVNLIEFIMITRQHRRLHIYERMW